MGVKLDPHACSASLSHLPSPFLAFLGPAICLSDYSITFLVRNPPLELRPLTLASDISVPLRAEVSFYPCLEEHPVFFPQLLETAPQSNENPSVDLLPPKSGESQL